MPEASAQRCAVTEPFTVLIIDDDHDQAHVLCERLERQGYKTLSANTGRLGQTIAETQRPNLVLLDLRLPDIDGFDVCQHLSDTPDTSHIPVIILSGMERPDIIRRSRAAGCQYFIRKPYDPNALLILVQQAIDEALHWHTV
jgi:CheY-like chemotaxis protein